MGDDFRGARGEDEIAIRAAIMPYSIAVAPSSDFRKSINNDFISNPNPKKYTCIGELLIFTFLLSFKKSYREVKRLVKRMG